jgi:Protein of unknown function (DUF3800)
MHLLYLDESGVPESHPTQSSHYVLLGMSVFVGTWFALNRQVEGLKKRYALGNLDDFELHASVLRRPYPEQAGMAGFEDLGRQARHDAVMDLRRRRENEDWPNLKGRARQEEARYFRQTNAFVHLTRREREELFSRGLGIVQGYRRGVTLFAEAIDKASLSPSIDPVEEAFTQVISRFERFLRYRSTRAAPVWGIVLVDQNKPREQRLTRLVRRFQQAGTKWGDIDRVVESPFFLDSALNSGVQVADLCAYALRRYLEKEERESFEQIFPKFYRIGRKLHGLRHFTRAGCRCLICQARGRS